MKFLVLAMCLCAANAASFGYKPRTYQPIQSFQPAQGYQPLQPAQAFASAVVNAPEVAYRAVEQPILKAVSPVEVYNAPVAVAKSAAYTAPVAVAKSAAYTAPVAVAKSTAYTAPVAVAKSAVYADKEASAGIVRSDSEVAADGYKYIYETDNGIAAQASGALKKIDNVDVLVSQGSYQYINPDGVTVQLSYIADENGYQPKSDILPVAPEIPVAIARSLEYIRAHPAPIEKY